MRLAIAGMLTAAFAAFAPAGEASAQDPTAGQLRSPVLVIDSERLYLASAFGQRIAAEVAADSLALGAENRAIEEDLTAEELDLTEKRATTEPAAFRVLADAFDEKVRRIRREQDAKALALSRRQDESRGAFLTASVPVLEAMMREAGAVVVLEQRTVFLTLNAVDITSAAVRRIDAQIGDGSSMTTAPQNDAPQDDARQDAPPETNP